MLMQYLLFCLQKLNKDNMKHEHKPQEVENQLGFLFNHRVKNVKIRGL